MMPGDPGTAQSPSGFASGFVTGSVTLLGRPPIHKRAMTNAERQRRYRVRKRHAAKAAKALIGKSQQRVINDRLTAEAGDRLDLSLARSEVREIDIAAARSIIEQYEPMPAVVLYAFGIFFDSVAAALSSTAPNTPKISACGTSTASPARSFCFRAALASSGRDAEERR